MINEEINKAIAEKVMGWCYHDVVQNDYGKHCKKCLLPLISLIEQPDMNFATEIHAAFQAVEKMKIGHFFELGTDIGGWYCKLFYFDGADKVEFITEEASTPSMAICLVALQAVS